MATPNASPFLLRPRSNRGRELLAYSPNRGMETVHRTDPEAEGTAVSGHQPLVLVASRDDALRRLGAECLRQAGFAVKSAGTGGEALSLFRFLKPALVLTQASSTEVDGLQLCSRIRALPESGHTPILLVCDSEPSELLERAYRAGATDLVMRPVNGLILHRRVQHLVRATRAFDEWHNSQARLQEARRIAVEASEKIERLVCFDELTGLPNPARFREMVGRALVRDETSAVAILYVDINNFREVNETLGCLVGDRVLQEFAERLRATAYRDESGPMPDAPGLARMGSDEFVLLVGAIDGAERVARAAKRILDATASPFLAGATEVFLSATIGIAVAPSDGEDVEDLIQHAHTAMYQAKKKGRGSYQFFAESMQRAASKSLELESGLRKALDRGELYLCYQPIVSCRSGRPAGVEALLRWRHPGLGELLPDEFIPVAEERGLMTSIGRWVLRTACLQARAWMEEGLPGLRLAVNVSRCQLLDGGLVDAVRDVLQEARLAPEMLELELSERGFLRADEATLRQLEQLKSLGVRLAVDDFGAGQSVLAYLKKLPLDVVKIDRSFVSGLAAESSDDAIVSAIIGMAHRLHLRVVAEGVETKEQAALLCKNGCDEIQGSFYTMPMPAGRLRDVLETWKNRA